MSEFPHQLRNLLKAMVQRNLENKIQIGLMLWRMSLSFVIYALANTWHRAVELVFLTVSDVGECAEENGECPQNCTNKLGYHICSCFSGYIDLYNNGTLCIGNTYMYFLILISITRQWFKYFFPTVTFFVVFKELVLNRNVTEFKHFRYAVNATVNLMAFWLHSSITICDYIVLQISMNVSSTMVDANISVRTHLEIAPVTAYLDMTSTMTGNLVSVTS